MNEYGQTVFKSINAIAAISSSVLLESGLLSEIPAAESNKVGVGGVTILKCLLFLRDEGPIACQSSSSVKFPSSSSSSSAIAFSLSLSWIEAELLLFDNRGDIFVLKNDWRDKLAEFEKDTLDSRLSNGPSSRATSSVCWLNDDLGFLGFRIPAKEGRRDDETDGERILCTLFLGKVFGRLLLLLALLFVVAVVGMAMFEVPVEVPL